MSGRADWRLPRWLLVGLALLGGGQQPSEAQQGANGGEWKHYAGDAGSTKYSPLAQINKDNVARLRVAWSYDSPDRALPEGTRQTSSNFENTPLMVGDTLYVTSSMCQIAAIDARTGQEKWVFDTQSYLGGRPTNLGFTHRGSAYWTDGQQQRLFLGTGDCYLWAIDLRTGKPVADFGEQGKVDLIKAIPRAARVRNYTVSSPPVICGDVVITNCSIADGTTRKEAPRGDIQGFDARTGKPLWIFHSVPQEGEFGADTWENESWKYSGNTNAWSCMSVDEELGYVYIPFGTPTNDWYGGQRPGDNLFAESLVCLNGKTGQRVWHFQTVHHGLWDYDIPAAPLLCNIRVEGRPIKAVAAVTKVGFCWVFDRTNGKPVWPIEERPVLQSTVEGERTSPTQPFPTRPAPFERQGATEENLTNFTPEIFEEAKQILAKFDPSPLFAPPTEKGVVALPGWGGGANWMGAAVDPESGLLFVPSVTIPITIGLVRPDASRSNFTYTRGSAPSAAGPRGLPLFKPPYGRITAIDLNTGEHAWMIAHGDGQRKRYSEIVGFDVGPMGGGVGGPLVTKTLLFVPQRAQAPGVKFGGGTANVIRAFDKATGQIVAEIPLPGQPNGVPMTYMAGGKQFIVLTTGDNRVLGLCLGSDGS